MERKFSRKIIFQTSIGWFEINGYSLDENLNFLNMYNRLDDDFDLNPENSCLGFNLDVLSKVGINLLDEFECYTKKIKRFLI